MGLSDGRKSFPIGLAVLIQYWSVTASQPASNVAVAITLNAKASSLKIESQSENSTHKCTNAVNNVQPVRNLSHMVKFFQYITDCSPEITKTVMGAREGQQFIHASDATLHIRRCFGSSLQYVPSNGRNPLPHKQLIQFYP